MEKRRRCGFVSEWQPCVLWNPLTGIGSIRVKLRQAKTTGFGGDDTEWRRARGGKYTGFDESGVKRQRGKERWKWWRCGWRWEPRGELATMHAPRNRLNSTQIRSQDGCRCLLLFTVPIYIYIQRLEDIADFN